MTRGRIARIWLSRNGWQARTSSGSGLRFWGGRHLRIFPMHTSARFILSPFSMMSVRSCPARPTNARPCSSSSAPGASPTNMSSARGLPWPKTMSCGPTAACSGGSRPASSRMAVRAAAGSPPARAGARRAAAAVSTARPPAEARRPSPATPRNRPWARRSARSVLALAHARAAFRMATTPRRGCARPPRASRRGARPAACRPPQEDDRVPVRPKPAPGAVTSLATTRSRFLASSFFAALSERGPRSRRRNRRGRARPSPPRGPSGCRASGRAPGSSGPSVFFSLEAARRGGPIVGDRGGRDHHRGRAHAPGHRPLHLLRRAHGARPRRRAGRRRLVGPDTRITFAPRSRAASAIR